MEAPAGSIVVFDSTTWHGSWPRTNPGLRVTAHTMRRIPALVSLFDFRDLDDDLIAASEVATLMRMLCWRDDPFNLSSDRVGTLPHVAGKASLVDA